MVYMTLEAFHTVRVIKEQNANCKIYIIGVNVKGTL